MMGRHRPLPSPTAALVVALVAVAAWSCDRDSSAAENYPTPLPHRLDPPSGFQRVTGADLHKLIVGRSLQPRVSGPSSHDTSGEEEFCLNGKYRRHADRVVMSGRYSIRDDQLCVVEDVTNYIQCRAIFTDRDGRIVARATNAEDIDPVSELEHGPRQPSC